MKHSRMVLILVGLFVTRPAVSQSNQAQVAEPQYVNSFSALDSTGKLIELEHQNVTKFHSKVKPLPGYASVKMSAEFKPAHSSVRLPAVSKFVVLGRSSLDPASLYELRVLKFTKDHREILMSQAHGTVFGASSTSNLSDGAIPIRFEEYGTSSYRISTQQPLPPGEYALAIRGAFTDLYCFGVDSAK
jgi:hypothetical protein